MQEGFQLLNHLLVLSVAEIQIEVSLDDHITDPGVLSYAFDNRFHEFDFLLRLALHLHVQSYDE